ncbi:DUF1120 domain-containing protein [Citrobacter europaeus]|uniref:DUF1120 domain-containing protein n=1 Tax=Citrobacter europaeus TaxID=1914243 RepID=UPI003AAFA31F
MKKTLLFTALSLCTASAFAADQTVLQVQGVLTNCACTPEIGGGTTIDYGTIHLSALSAVDNNQLGAKETNLVINCPVPTQLGFQVTDDRTDSVAKITIENAGTSGGVIGNSKLLFGVGKTANDVNIGNYNIRAASGTVTADGNSASLLVRFGPGGYSYPWHDMESEAGYSTVFSHNEFEYTVGKFGTEEPLAFTTVTIPLITTLAIQNTTALAITDDTNMDGQATFTMIYL